MDPTSATVEQRDVTGPQPTSDDLQIAAEIERCMKAQDTDSALVALRDRLLGENPASSPYPDLSPSMVGSVAAFVATALTRSHRDAEVLPFFSDFAFPRLGRERRRIRLLIPTLVDEALARRDQAEAMMQIEALQKAYENIGPNTLDALRFPPVAALLRHPKAQGYGMFTYDPAWVLERQEKTLALAPLNHDRPQTRSFETRILRTALLAELPRRALPLLEAKLPLYRETVGRYDDFSFYAVCIFAVLERYSEALDVAQDLVRRGYRMSQRFNPETPQGDFYPYVTRTREWLGKISETAGYQTFLREDIAPLFHDSQVSQPVQICALHDDILSGKKKKRCFITNKMIEPGTPVVVVTRLSGPQQTTDTKIAGQAAFAASKWQKMREDFEANRMSVADLFLPTRDMWRAPAIARFYYDVAKSPASLDIDRAVSVIADHAPPPIRRTWITHPEPCHDRPPAFPPFADDKGHGDAVNLAWHLIKAGLREEMLVRVSSLPQDKADKMCSMLATFQDPVLRTFAARHFEIPNMPQVMEIVFKNRLTLEDHLLLADFGARHPRWRSALVSAMQSYGLHLYSEYQRGVNCNFQGLEHYGKAAGGQLLFFLTHHPEDDEVLETMVRTAWLPCSPIEGLYTHYTNACPYYFRSAAFYLALHLPQRLVSWLSEPWIEKFCTGGKERDTIRLLAKLRGKRKAPTRAKD